MKRRTFLKIAGGALAGAGVAGGLGGAALQAALKKSTVTGETLEVPTFCEICFWKCGMIAKVRDGKVVKLEGNPKHPLSNGKLCPRGNGATGLIYDPDRLTTPLIRVNNRGTEQFREATWDEALDVVAERMGEIRDKYGPEALALFFHGFGAGPIKNLIKAYGSPNIAAPSYAQCRGPREVGFETTFGEGVSSPERTDIKNARMLVLMGSHLGENMHNTQVQEFSAAVHNGVKLVVVDPRFSTAAGKANWYLPIKPGTDIALLLAWMNVIINEGLYDKDFVNHYTIGFDQLRAHVQAYTPERVWTITGIEPEQIRATARAMGHEKPGVLIHPGRHTTWYGDDTQRSRAIAMLTALLGAWGRKGGYYYPGSVSVPGLKHKPFPKPARPAVDRPAGQYTLANESLASGLWDASFEDSKRDYPIRAWFVYGTNLLNSLPNPEKTREALSKLDFVVVSDVLPMEITGWADVVLPDATFLERYDDLATVSWREPFVAIRQPVVAPVGNVREPYFVARELAKRLGIVEYFPHESMKDYIQDRAEKAGLDFETLQRDGVIKFPRQPMYFEEGVAPSFWTESGKVELYSSALARVGQDPMPKYTNHGDPPKGYYRLLFGRAPMHTFGRTTNNPVLTRVMAENEVWVNHEVAVAWGLRHGQMVKLQNQDGVVSNNVKVKVTERIRPDAVFMVHGFGHTAKHISNHKGANDSELVTHYKTDPVMGGTGMNVNFVTFIV